jgi:hypothetical protein
VIGKLGKVIKRKWHYALYIGVAFLLYIVSISGVETKSGQAFSGFFDNLLGSAKGADKEQNEKQKSETEMKAQGTTEENTQ